MTETKPLIGVSWEPKLPGLMGASINKDKKFSDEHGCSALWKPNSDLVDGPYVPPKDPAKLKKLIRKQDKDTLGKDWFDMPAPTLTPELKKDLQLLKLRSVIDPKRHYKKGDSKSKTLPKYFQVFWC
uniref:rRNA-processing protein fcf2 n=1 Tax=Rhizophora mucronata TaxID=61149 RepID=A0A2P2LYS9_RHIMU